MDFVASAKQTARHLNQKPRLTFPHGRHMEQAAVSQLDHRQALGMWSAATVATSLKPWISSRQPSKLRAI